MPNLGTFRVVHPTYAKLCESWMKARALYDSPLRCTDEDLEKLFPRHHGEEDSVYEERKKRAFYEPYAGEIVDKITANVFTQSVRVQPAMEEGQKDRPTTPDDEFYSDFERDASKPSDAPGTEQKPLQDICRDMLREAQLTKMTWVQVCLPNGPAEATNLAEEDAQGTRRAYLVLQPAESVINWRFDDDGHLIWLVHCREEDTRDTFDSDPCIRRVVYTVWDQDKWTEYSFTWDDSKKKFNELPDETPPDDGGEDTGGHSFGGVPWVCMDLPDGLWTMGKLSSQAIELFNKHAALSWAEYRNLFPILASFLSGEDVLSPATSNPNRGQTQRMSPGYAPQFGEKDRLEFISPDAAPYEFTLKHLQHLRDEMHRVVHQMAQSLDNTASAVGRSGDSKAQDKGAEATVSNAFGNLVRLCLMRIYALVSAGRGEEVDWEVEGLTDFDAENTATMVEEAGAVELINIPSATFQRLYKGRLARRLLGEDLSPEDSNQIDEELEGSLAQEQFDVPSPREEFDAEQENAQAAIDVKAKAASKGSDDEGGSFA